MQTTFSQPSPAQRRMAGALVTAFLAVAVATAPPVADACNDEGPVIEVGGPAGFPHPRVSGSLATGDYVVTWDTSDVHARVNTQPAFLVNQTTSGNQEHADVSHDLDGNFWVVWRDVTNTSIVMRGFKVDGTPFTDEMVVRTAANVGDPRIDHMPDNGFVVVWPEDTVADNDYGFENLFARRFDPGGDPTSGVYRVNQVLNAGEILIPQVSCSPTDGTTVITWTDGNAGISIFTIKAKGYEADGTILIPEFTVNDQTGIYQESDVSHDKWGNFWIIYVNFNAAQNDVFGKLFDPDGDLVEPQKVLMDGNVSHLSNPAIDHHPVFGNFTIVCRTVLSGAWNRVIGRCFFGDGTPNAPGFIVSSTPDFDSHADPAIAYYNDTDFVVAWKAEKEGNPGKVYQRVYTQTAAGVTPLAAPAIALQATSRPSVFRAQTTIGYELPVAGTTTLRIYDVAGRAVRTLIDSEARTVGAHQVTWDGRADDRRSVGAGTYFYKLDHTAAGASHDVTGKVVRVR